MKLLQQLLRLLEIIIKVVTWIIVNGVPFFRGIWEEIQAMREKAGKKRKNVIT